MRGFCVKFWRGEFALPLVYWVFGVLVPLLALLVISLVVARVSNMTLALSMARVFLAALFSYQLVWMVSTWRAANNYRGPQQWALAAKTVVVLMGLFCFGLANDLLSLQF